MPVKAKAKAKAKRNKQADERAAYVKFILDANGPEVEEAVENMCVTMSKMAPTVSRATHMWVAVRLLVAAAEWDIRISGFSLPKKQCARCGKKVK